MAEECNHDCSSCGTTCGDDTRKQDLHEKPHELSNIRHVVAVVSGKGGVGKSLVTGLMSVAMARKGCHVGIMDADITGPSIPKMFGVDAEIRGNQNGAYPVSTAGGIDIVSMNLLLDNNTDPVVWRGPIISGVVKQFWHDFIWNDIDYMFIDMPPGTGDVPLTVMQSIQLDGIIIVTSPQERVSMIVEKAVKMAAAMNVPILGIVENMSYFVCPDCGKKHEIFGDSKVEQAAKEFSIPNTAKIPIDPAITAMVDNGEVEYVSGEYISGLVDSLEKTLPLEEET